MTEASNTQLMDTEPGGENTQYEGQQSFTKSHTKDKGQFGDSIPSEASQQADREKAQRGEKTAENMRYGEALSEHGFGGETVGNNISGSANAEEKFGEIEDQSIEGQQSRRAQGYGGGSGVGA